MSFFTLFVEFCIFAMGLTSLAGGVLALCNPRNQYQLKGISEKRSSDDPASFAPIYMLAARDISFGIFILAHQFHDNHTAIATILAVMSFMKFGDLLTVLAVGDGNRSLPGILHFFMGIGYLGCMVYLSKN
ncbi:hypothetical protein FVEG_12201 [Fusarium verticillioides 7600]|uniref:Uncharacterized protein n=1 Tax=Gibberella moniliformis (strain M3125 / FGSC 7600) TaxID=334819 RepID=W7N127_GIBM7|nr:hypothetical protein FVEG_12201 [Fusarium verticillioides 7600]EWG53865.1 hypothetical protein FVEG_12201 [Fusarium verticillioides 7600]